MLVKNFKEEKKHLCVERLQNSNPNASIREISFFLDSVQKNLMDQVPWAFYNYLPRVQFALAYGSQHIYLKFYVSEKFIKAANGVANSAVCEDSCVEFFITLDDGKTYYNFEFNCIGTALIGHGKAKTDRNLLPASIIGQVKYQSLIANDLPAGNVHWELAIAIPFTVFYFHQVTSVDGKKFKGNFYKCGDHLPVPHYVTWSNIVSPGPDFHLPEFFGTLQFL